MNEAIKTYYKDLIKDDDMGLYSFLYPIYDETQYDVLSEDKFYQETISFNSSRDKDFQQYINLLEYVDVEISFDDIKNYLNDKNKSYLDIEPDMNNYNFEYDNVYENLEYDAKYNYLNISKELLDKLRLRNPEKISCKLGLYGGNQYEVQLPFITSYTKEYTIPELSFNVNYDSMILNRFKNKTYINIDNTSPLIFGNIPFEWLKKMYRKPRFCSYCLNEERFYILNKDVSRIEELMNDICKNGLLNPLPLGVNGNGKLIDSAQCNTCLMIALYLQLPYIPSIIYVCHKSHITETIDAVKNDRDSYDIATEYCNPYIKFREKKEYDVYEREQ